MPTLSIEQLTNLSLSVSHMFGGYISNDMHHLMAHLCIPKLENFSLGRTSLYLMG